MNPLSTHEDFPGLDGPDYVTLVIEWNDEDEVTTVSARAPELIAPTESSRAIVTVLGALLAVGLATWGLHRLRAAA